MPCYTPLKGYRSREVTKNGKRPIVFDATKGYPDLPVEVPCGKCIGCRLERSRQWAIRILHEASMHEENCFITLTYDKENIPYTGTLVLEHFQNFMKRLRKYLGEKKIRFFHCGEYGDNLKRPHYHCIIFGHDFTDRDEYDVGCGRIHSSPTLAKLWPYGFNTVGDVTFESAAYVARYVIKKVTGEKEVDHYLAFHEETGEILGMRKPEYITMSRRGGIGEGWFKVYKEMIARDDSVIIRGKEMKPPKFYDLKLSLTDPEIYAINRARRINAAERKSEHSTEERLKVRKKIAELKFRQKNRGYESDEKTRIRGV